MDELKKRREEISNKLTETAFKMAELGRDLYNLKEELRIINIKINKHEQHN